MTINGFFPPFVGVGGGPPPGLLAVHFPPATVLFTESIIAIDSPNFSFSFWIKSEIGIFPNNFAWEVDKSSVLAGAQNFNAGFGGDAALGDLIVGDSDLGAGFQGNVLSMETVADVDASAWTSIIGSVKTDLSSGSKILKIYVNRVDTALNIVDAFPSFTMTANGFPLTIGQSDIWGGDVAEFWWAMDQSLLTGSDIASGTLDKFVTGGLKAVELGANGELPTGTSPTIYMHGGAATFATNLGTGGDTFGVVGDPLTDATTTPY